MKGQVLFVYGERGNGMYMDGITLTTDNHAREIEEIAAYGSLEVYKTSLNETRDAYQVDMDYRLSKLELGI